MPKPKTLLMTVPAAAIVAFLAFTLTRPSEPSYNGHSLSSWINAAASGSTEAENAVTKIGTNAIPSLLRWVEYESPPWRRKLALMAYDRDRIEIVDFLYREELKAITGFRILGSNACPAIPALVSIMKDTNHEEAAFKAIRGLGGIGEQALPYLTNEFSATDQRHRIVIMTSIASMPQSGAPTNLCLAPLLAATADPDVRVRIMATNCVLRLAPAALTITPSH